MPRILREVQRQFPELEIHQVEIGVPGQFERLADGRLDVGFGRASLAPAEVAFELVRLDPPGVLVARNHRFATLPAGRLHRRSIAALAVLYAALAMTAMVLIFVVPIDEQGQLTGSGTALIIIGELLLLVLVIGGWMHQVWLRRQVYQAPPPHPRIGRPDLPGDYDDGGLVDLNNAPAAMIATACELTPQTADGIVTARVKCGGFLTVEDLFSMADIPIGAWDMVRDRAVVIPPTA